MRFHRFARISTGIALTLAASVAAGVLVGPGSAGADTRDDKRRVDGRISDAKENLEGTSADLVRAYLRLRRTKAELPVARAELTRAQARVVEARARDLEIGRRLRVAEVTVQQAVHDLNVTAAASTRASDRVGGIARQAYQTGGIGELSVALAAQDANDFAQRVAAIDTALHLQGRVLADLDVRQAETRAQRTRLIAVRRQVALLKAQSAANLERARGLEREAVAAKARVDALLTSQRRDVAAIAARKAAERSRLDKLQAQQRQLEAKLRALAARQRRNGSGGSDGGSGSWGGYLSLPVAGVPVSSEFGQRFHPILHIWRLHAGIDFAAPCGTPLHAAATGEVISAGVAGGYGNRIMVSHGQVRNVSLVTAYNHLSRITVSSGPVTRGQIIGYTGTTGTSTGCHLHFETYENGTPLNPRRWL